MLPVFPSRAAHRAGTETEGWGDSRDSTTTAQGKAHKRQTLLQIPLEVNKRFLAKSCSAQRKLRLF